MELKDSGYSIRKIEKELKANKLEASRSTIQSILNLENKGKLDRRYLCKKLSK